MRNYEAAGYSPVPCRNGRPVVGGFHSGDWRYNPSFDDHFADCDIGLLCASRPRAGASGNATLDSVASTWIAGVRVVSPHKKLRNELAALVERLAGAAPCRQDGDELLYVFRCNQPLNGARQLAAVTLPGDKPTRLDCVPTRIEVLSVGAYCIVSGGTWRNGTLPEVRRNALPALTLEQANAITTEVENLLNQRGACPWI
jgi:hypothetical protein